MKLKILSIVLFACDAFFAGKIAAQSKYPFKTLPFHLKKE